MLPVTLFSEKMLDIDMLLVDIGVQFLHPSFSIGMSFLMIPDVHVFGIYAVIVWEKKVYNTEVLS